MSRRFWFGAAALVVMLGFGAAIVLPSLRLRPVCHAADPLNCPSGGGPGTPSAPIDHRLRIRLALVGAGLTLGLGLALVGSRQDAGVAPGDQEARQAG